MRRVTRRHLASSGITDSVPCKISNDIMDSHTESLVPDPEQSKCFSSEGSQERAPGTEFSRSDLCPTVGVIFRRPQWQPLHVSLAPFSSGNIRFQALVTFLDSIRPSFWPGKYHIEHNAEQSNHIYFPRIEQKLYTEGQNFRYESGLDAHHVCGA